MALAALGYKLEAGESESPDKLPDGVLHLVGRASRKEIVRVPYARKILAKARLVGGLRSWSDGEMFHNSHRASKTGTRGLG